MSNGTDALELALRAAGIAAGDEVLVPVNTFIATALAVVRAGARPVFVDCDAEHSLIDPSRIAAAVSSRAKAVIPVHLYGQMAAMDPILEIAGAHRLQVVEDFAQAHGARQQGRAAGTVGRVAATSFYPGKNLGAYGDAGAVVTADDELAESLRRLRNHGSPRRYDHPQVGFNCRMDALQAVVLRAKLERPRRMERPAARGRAPLRSAARRLRGGESDRPRSAATSTSTISTS